MAERSWEHRLRRPDAAALYLHVPFCARKCAYCDFASWPCAAEDQMTVRYREALEREVFEACDLGLLERTETAYVGGGTPTLLGPALGPLVGSVRGAVPRLAELTCEANPDSLSDSVLDAVASAGATRLSVGVQSLHDDELAELGRIHDAACARERVAEAVSRGLDVSVDLMCAIPLQTRESWSQTLSEVLSLGVCHLSVYPLAIEEGTPLAARTAGEDPSWNDPDVQADRMAEAEGMLEAAGLTRYEVASYALPGHACRHNVAYWTGMPYLGIGTGAASMLAREGYDRLRSLCGSLPEAPRGSRRARLLCTTGRGSLGSLSEASFDVEFLDGREAAAEDLMLGARLARGLDPALVSHARDILGQRLDDCLCGLIADGYLTEALAPTRKGWLLGNELFGRLWGLAHEE